ncbi:hypothetical protein [Nostoc sp.]
MVKLGSIPAILTFSPDFSRYLLRRCDRSWKRYPKVLFSRRVLSLALMC